MTSWPGHFHHALASQHKGQVMQSFCDLFLAKHSVQQTVELMVICDEMKFMWRHCDDM